jgi:hypothetical protein
LCTATFAREDYRIETNGGKKMNNKEIVAQAIFAVVKEDLTLEQVSQLLENPKSC